MASLLGVLAKGERELYGGFLYESVHSRFIHIFLNNLWFFHLFIFHLRHFNTTH